MSIDEFNNTPWDANMFCYYHGERMYVIAVNFEERLLALVDDKQPTDAEDWIWVRCESISMSPSLKALN